jgi:hypothetical protein
VATDANTSLRADVGRLREDNRLKDGKILLMSHYIEDVGKVHESPGQYKYRLNVAPELYAEQTLEGVAGVMDPIALRKKIDDFGAGIDIAATKGVDDLFGSVTTKVNGLKQRVSDIESERDKTLGEKNALDANFQAATAAHSQKAGEFSRNLEQSRADYEASKGTKDNQIAQLQQSVRDRVAELETTKEQHTTEKKAMQNEIGKLQMHNTALVNKDKLRVPADVADGKVVSARSGLPSAYINLGRKDMLQPGTIFRVRNPNSEAVKAYATVMRVEQDRAEVELSGVVEPIGDAVREGDQLYNDLYSPGRSSKRTIYLMGRFGYPYNKPQLQALLENLGNTVVGKMGPGIDTVVLGDDPVNESGDGFSKVEESEEYKLAVGLGVEFAPLRKIRDLLKL